MNREEIHRLLQEVAAGALSPEAAFDRLRNLPFEDLGFAHVDHHRALRTGYPEVIFCQGKSCDQVLEIAGRMVEQGSLVLATRASGEIAQALCDRCPHAERDPVARTVVIRDPASAPAGEEGRILVISAGTSDLPVAREAVVTARVMGARVESIFDVGVAGIHRLLAYREQMRAARVLVVAAGMEGALASVVGGLVEVPVIAVPTSVGYGASFHGLSALLTMLNSCASGVLVVNIQVEEASARSR